MGYLNALVIWYEGYIREQVDTVFATVHPVIKYLTGEEAVEYALRRHPTATEVAGYSETRDFLFRWRLPE